MCWVNNSTQVQKFQQNILRKWRQKYFRNLFVQWRLLKTTANLTTSNWKPVCCDYDLICTRFSQFCALWLNLLLCIGFWGFWFTFVVFFFYQTFMMTSVQMSWFSCRNINYDISYFMKWVFRNHHITSLLICLYNSFSINY